MGPEALLLRTNGDLSHHLDISNHIDCSRDRGPGLEVGKTIGRLSWRPLSLESPAAVLLFVSKVHCVLSRFALPRVIPIEFCFEVIPVVAEFHSGDNRPQMLPEFRVPNIPGLVSYFESRTGPFWF
jgi:hypothetical protein